jgi:N6-L-threonylcarbamoyladenine synthase
MSPPRCILAIETSCDDTAAALLRDGTVVAEMVHSQADLHSYYGGVVPELASRDHVAHIGAVCAQVIAGYEDEIDLVAATRGPGLIGGLLVGLQWAKSYAFGRRLPFVGVHHLAGHLATPLLDPKCTIEPPFVALLVSGGHTQLYAVDAWGSARALGGTRDDAAGEAFDKSARLLGLGYPGGPAIQAAAALFHGHAKRLPRPMWNRGLEMSFSGLKTALRDEVKKRCGNAEPDPQIAAELAHSVQDAIVDVLAHKACLALETTGYSTLTIGGGVAANGPLRARLKALAHERDFRLYVPPLRWCTDNAAMIGAAAQIRFARYGADPFDQAARARWPLSEEWSSPGLQTKSAKQARPQKTAPANDPVDS